MGNIHKAINQIVNAINWRDIKQVHRKLNLLWEFEENEKIIKRIPTINELKDELRSMILHMNDEDLDYISYGSWVIFWERDYDDTDNLGGLRLIFRVADFVFEGTPHKTKKEILEEALNEAISKEDYEQAAVLRDMLKKKQKTNK